MKNKLSLFLLFFICTALTQKETKYNYILNNRFNSNEKGAFIGMELEFSTTRDYISQAEFRESRLFTGSKEEYITYKIKNDIWYYKKDNKWQLFYNCKKNQGGNISLLGNTYSIVFNKEVNIRSRCLHKISLIPTKIKQSHRQTYFLNCKSGVVAIMTSTGNILIRDDYFKSPLSSEEIGKL